MAVYDYTDYIKNFEPKDVKYDELLVNLQQEIKLLKSNQLNNLPFECFKVDEIKSILSNLLPSSTRLNQLKNSLPASGSNAKFLDQVLLSPPPAPPSQSYTQVPDDLELDKFINELTILKKDVLKKPYKSFTSSALNKCIDEKMDEVFNSKFHGPKIFKPVNSTEFGIHRGNVYQFVRLSKRLTRLFEVNGGNTEVLDFLIHSQSVFNDMEAKIREKKLAKLASKATTKENDKPYVQIPDDLELHKFTKELEIFKNDELKSSFKNFSPDKINSLLDKRINEIYNDLPNTNPASRLSKENVFEFMRLSKRITRLFDMNGGNTQVLDSVIQSQSILDSVEAKIAQKKKEKELKATERDTYETKPYTQIPDDLELHNFINELEILKNDELKASFGNFSAEKINSLLDKRINEIYNDLPNTNPVSRLSKENIYEFMRLSKRLTRLFNTNNGNTAILDTLLKNQSILNNVERKIAEKKVSEKPAVKPYIQIPDDLELHKFTKELEIFKNDELKSSFKNFSPDKINSLLDKRINEIYNDLPNTNLASRLSKDNVYDFMRLSKRLTRLFDINGGHTGVLDTLLQSQSVFDNVDSMIKKRRLSSTNISAVPASPLPYRQVPDDFMLEEYMVDLLQLRSELGDDFKKFDTDKIMQQLRNMIDNVKKYNLDKRITFSKLYRNLSLLFKHNGQQSFILDNVLINAQTYSDFEGSLANRRLNNTIETQPEELSKPKQSKDRLQIPTDEEYTNKFNMEEFINNPPNKKTQYNDSEYLISLLTKNGEPSELDNEDLLKSELAFKDAVSNALNNKASKFEENPEEFDELKKFVKTIKTNQSPEKEAGEKKANVDKETLQDFLQNAKKENELAKERRFRESKAYEWSKSMCNSNRTLESHNFFNPLLSISKSKDSEDLLFPDANKINRNGERKYLILTPNGSKVVMNENPFGPYHADEDIFSVLNKFSEEDFKRLCKVIKRYQSKNWKLIGGGGKEKILVFTRVKFDKKKFVLTKLKTAFATAGVVFMTLFGLNYWSGNLDHVQRNERITPPPPNPTEETKDPQSTSSMANKTNEANGASEKSLWSGLFWK
ncbi:hypothetical protein QCA50_015891 [Cerrena zonata]|uniref:Uncharacterized protein n=1 Tax=Cerrena zonata TaxID=2478898 RepID=A0AAW0FS57_9APHY